MYSYDVGVRSNAYHGKDTLTYTATEPIPVGTLVSVPLRSSSSLGVVLGNGSAPRHIRAKAIDHIYQGVGLPQEQQNLLLWLRHYYPAPLASIVQLFTPASIEEIVDHSRAVPSAPKAKLPPLTDEQRHAIKLIQSSSSPTSLLHGDTGTGKTRVYIELAREVIENGRSVVVLVPEIGLTPQMEQRFADQFPGLVQTIHSGMTIKQRRTVWRQVHDAKTPQVVIGPRSALFMPIAQLGLIIVDEAHDKGYKQDQLPYYDATRVAAKLAQVSKAQCVYGTATPRIADYWQLVKHQTPIARLTKPVQSSVRTPEFQIIDAAMRDVFTRSTMFSDEMLDAIGKHLSRGQQALVFLNRRGTARFINCQNCGWHAACPVCDTPLTYHGDSHQLRCHTCGRVEPVHTSCPQCQSAELRFQRRGTKALQTELEKHFPQARIARFDSDNTKQERLQSRFSEVAAGDVDIIVGTQVISKGLDLEHLSLVCIPQADLSTHLPDFTADEQTFQLLRQVVGRVGRQAQQASEVLIQSYAPDSALLAAVVENNWQAFYNAEIKHRRAFNFPPFCYLLQLTISRKTIAGAEKAATSCAEHIAQEHPNVTILGPAPRFQEKVQGQYQWQIIVKATSRSTLLDIISKLPNGWRYNIDPSDLL